MKLIFAGTPEFAASALAALLASGHDVALVLTRSDRPAGRGMQTAISPVKKLALKTALRILQPIALRSPQLLAALSAVGADAMVVAAYGLILPQEVLSIPKFGCLNIHASLLPRWRGAAPIQRALLAGDAETGISIMQMDAGLDSGPVLLRERVAIAGRETADTLHDKLAAIGARGIVVALTQIAESNPGAVAQSEAGATYAVKISKAEAAIDWRRPAVEIDRAIRAYDPFPVARIRIRGANLKIWRAQPTTPSDPDGAEPGTILGVDRSGIVVACGAGAIRVEEVQKAGGRRLSAGDFLPGFPLHAGERFEIAATR